MCVCVCVDVTLDAQMIHVLRLQNFCVGPCSACSTLYSVGMHMHHMVRILFHSSTAEHITKKKKDDNSTNLWLGSYYKVRHTTEYC